MPLLPRLLPPDKLVNFPYCLFSIHLPDITRTLEERIHVELPTCGTLPQETQNALQPSHQLSEKPVIMNMHLVHKLVEVVFVACTQVYERLHSLVRICRHVLSLAMLNDSDSIVGKHREIGDGIIDIGGLVDTNEGFVKNSEEIAEEGEGGRFLDYAAHHGFIALPCIHLEKLLEGREELSALTHFFVNLGACLVSNDERWEVCTYEVEIVTHTFDRTVPGYIGIEHLAYLLGGQLRRENFRS